MTERAAAHERMTEYDGLRGFAAFAVLWAHVFAPLFQGGVWADNAVAQALWFSPLHFMDGSVAVYTFFALSGFVLTRMCQGASFDFGRWVPSRVTRLMVPILAAIAVNLLVILTLRGLPILDQQNV
jgi:peptidoglycan/LPS O-acetylase OafA/YrhL